MSYLFQLVLYQPIFNVFVGLYNLIPDAGVVILIITALIRLVLYPLNSKSIKAQKSLMDLQPKMEELKKKYKDNQQVLAQETMKLYKENKVSPFGSCLPLLIQLPIFIALYQVLRDGLTSNDMHLLYPFIPNPGSIKQLSLGFINLTNPNYVLAALAALAQFWQTKMMNRKTPPKQAGEGGKDENMMAMMNKQMLYMMPALTFIIGLKLPGGLSLYWFLSTLFAGLQQYLMFRKKDGDNDKQDVIEGKLVK